MSTIITLDKQPLTILTTTPHKTTKWSDTSTKPLCDLAVVIGRFQPFHNGHLELLKNASLLGKKTLVLVGSSCIARNIKNPFTFDEREEMILNICNDQGIRDVVCQPIIDDLYSDTQWMASVQNEVENVLGEMGNPNGSVMLVGHHSDESSYYLDVFPKYTYFEVPKTHTMHSQIIREIFFHQKMIPHNVMPNSVVKFLEDFQTNETKTKFSLVYQNLCDEYKFIQDYKKQFANAPFPPIFTTTDAVVINNGYILLVKRRMAPGRGLWALPGGFLGEHERIEDSMLRELDEETRIKISKEELRASIKGNHVFDAPNRSLRGRTITHAYLIVLQERSLPKVRGSDDAERARWFPISEFYNMSHEMYEDHYSIGTFLINRAG